MENEKQLIYVNVLVKDLELLAKNEDSFRQSVILGVVQTVKAQPTVDAVEVVRCKDCKHRGTDYCIFHIKGEPADEELLRKLDNDFCSCGERKEGDGNG